MATSGIPLCNVKKPTVKYGLTRNKECLSSALRSVKLANVYVPIIDHVDVTTDPKAIIAQW